MAFGRAGLADEKNILFGIDKLQSAKLKAFALRHLRIMALHGFLG
jgi:hypothetical protein